jgi:class 3 adenylate cyclase
LEKDNDILLNFSKNISIEMTVLSIDIRKSTELMLKAITPDNYAEFISGLTEGLKTIVVNNYGVFDKFTGDGILAYFPKFYSGEDGILNCCIASQECHNFFSDFYKKYYKNFSVLLDTGLGIGIDHGMVKIVMINQEQTIVGSSVVYACRLSGAPAGKTYLNRLAFNNIVKYGINTKKIRMDIKDEGKIFVYELKRIIDKNISIPNWVNKK